MAFLMLRAEVVDILRTVPIQNCDVSYLVTNFHRQPYNKQKQIDFVCHFVEDINAKIRESEAARRHKG